MKMRQYSVVLKPDTEQGGFWVTVPSLPGCYSQGDTVEAALAMVKDAIALYIEDLIATGEPIPEETVRPQLMLVDIAA